MSELLAFHDVKSGYGASRILHDVNISINEHERVAIVGRNGVGKTTLVNTFLGIARLSAGEVRFFGSAPRVLRRFTAARAGVSIVPQGRHIIKNLTVNENLLLGAAVNRPGHWNMQRVYDLFPALEERKNNPGTALSGGQQQMLAIGRALMANPALLVLDEPSEGLAPVIVDELADVLNQLADSGTGLLLIEQNLGLLVRIARRYYALSKGAVVGEGTMDHTSTDTLKEYIAV